MLNFFDDFHDIFEKLTNNFSRPVKDQQPFSVYSNDKGYVVVCNTLGIDRNDLRVNVTKEHGNPHPVLSITGESKIEKINFSNNINLRIRLCTDAQIESVSFETKNGLTFVYLKTKVHTPESIKGSYIDEGSNPLDW